jgi:hypothetical protein
MGKAATAVRPRPREIEPTEERPPRTLKRLTVDIPEPLHMRLRVAAIRQRATIADVLGEALERYLPKEPT